jgi:hypothetical protein
MILDLMLQIAILSLNYFLKVWFWIVLGFLLAGFVYEFIPRRFFLRYLGEKNAKSIGYASILGVLTDVCSHGVLPLGIAIFHGGATASAAVAFILATPWIGTMETVILYSFLGLEMTIIVSGLSVVIAFVTGCFLLQLEKRGLIKAKKVMKMVGHKCVVPEPLGKGPISRRVLSAISYSWTLAKMIWIWFLIGFLGAGIAGTLVPESVVKYHLGFCPHSIPIALGLSILIEVCSEGTVPIVGQLYSMGASPGVVFLMLMGGVITDITELGTIWTIMGRRIAIANLLIALTLTVLLAYTLNWLWLLT